MALERAGCSSRLSPSCPPHILPQALCLRRSVEELEKWLEPVELRESASGAQSSLGWTSSWGLRESWTGRPGPHRPLSGEGHCLAQDLEEQAQQLLQR